MYIVVVHHISHPEKFWDILSANPSMPEGFGVKAVLPNTDGSKAVCIWQAPDIASLKKLVNDTVGDYSSNSFMEVDGSKAFGLS
ncbi:MAG TPA: hypothetical protein VG847_15965 [Chitinophagaceae bacterium]|nr:hypothetical protein [Chitinophagaceae bacterium]